MQKLNRAYVGAGSFLVAMVAMTGAAFASATYDVSPVATSVTSELTSNLPVILGVIGALIALAIAVRAIRKFVKV